VTKTILFDTVKAAVAHIDANPSEFPHITGLAFDRAIKGVDFGDAQQTNAFLMPQLMRIETGMYMVRYPAIDYADFMPVDTAGNIFTAGSLYYSGDIAGTPEWFDMAADDMPYADTSRTQFLQENHMAAIGYKWNRADLERSQQLGINLLAEKADAASRSAERFIHKVAMLGDGVKFSTGFIDDANMTVTTAANNITSTSSADDDIETINTLLQAVESGTLETYRADTLALPTSIYNILATKRLSGTMTSVLEYLRNTSVVGPVRVLRSRHLENAGVGGVERMIAYANMPEVHRFHLPGGGHQFFPAWQKGPFSWEVPGVMSIGGYELRIPLAKVAADNNAT
jgi:hypothetical protein